MGKSAGAKGPKNSCENRNQNREPDLKSNNSIQMELELLALKTKNAELIKAYAKLTHDYYELNRESLNLRRDLVELQAQHQSQVSAYKNMMSELKNCTPSVMEIANLFVKISENSATTMRLTPKTKAVTQPVKPHTVNGTVLMNPTISLTRMSGSRNDSVAESCLPSTSSGSREYNPFRTILPDDDGDDDDSAEDTQDEDNHIQNVRVQRGLSRAEDSFNVSDSNPELAEMMDSGGEENEPAQVQSSPSNGLSTILEESRAGSIGEVRIFLSRLSDQDMALETQNNTRTSIEASVADNTYLNIETTLIENQLMGGRLRTDIMVFSPKGNSTRLGTISPYGDLDELKVSSNEIQSAVVTPSVNIEGSLSRFESRIPTPSMSVLGDIDKGSSRLAILAEDPDGLSPIRASTVTKRTKRKTKRQSADSFHNGDSSPLTARSSNVATTSTFNFVLNSPTVVLEKLEHMDTRTASAEEEENEKPQQSSKPRSKTNPKVSKSNNKSPNMPAKRAKIDHETIKDIQIRLSKVISPDSSEQQDNEESISAGSRRPPRAARPKNLKETSLVCKMRRMF